jgi:hypothetical protein
VSLPRGLSQDRAVERLCKDPEPSRSAVDSSLLDPVGGPGAAIGVVADADTGGLVLCVGDIIVVLDQAGEAAGASA